MSECWADFIGAPDYGLRIIDYICDYVVYCHQTINSLWKITKFQALNVFHYKVDLLFQNWVKLLFWLSILFGLIQLLYQLLVFFVEFECLSLRALVLHRLTRILKFLQERCLCWLALSFSLTQGCIINCIRKFQRLSGRANLGGLLYCCYWLAWTQLLRSTPIAVYRGSHLLRYTFSQTLQPGVLFLDYAFHLVGCISINDASI